MNSIVRFRHLPICLLISMFGQHALFSQDSRKARELLVRAILAEDDDTRETLVREMADTGDSIVADVFEQWKRGEVFVYETPDGKKVPFTLESPESTTPSPALTISNGEPLAGPNGKPLSFIAKDITAVDTDRGLRKEMKNTTDFLALAASDPDIRAQAAFTIGMMQNQSNLDALERRLAVEEEGKVREVLREGIAITNLESPDKGKVVEALRELADLHSIAGRDYIIGIVKSQEDLPEAERDSEIYAAARSANRKIDDYLKIVDTFGTAFRGLSLGSVLLIVALGLAITFGLMGVINMAHGEMIAIGAYATYLTEKWFTAWFGADGFGFEVYFIFAIPFAFLSAAFFGAILERGIIQFLYKRPLESLLATWGVSLIIQQGFRLIFGASNRQVNSPAWMMGSFEVSDVTMGYNRLFVIGFAVLIVLGTWLLMTKTPIGLCIRSVMQNPQMAACMGIRTQRVRMLTFAFGSGLAGLAGAFISQIGNVGPALGQSYIVDSFMVVVAGGAGNLIGTVISALSIGVVDQVLQPFLGPVMGKVCVLVAIILFLQWRPGGLFPTKSRALD